ncbi:MAG: F0F1 ATP synthase subunit gamma, partial [Candidatus Aminicenantes bacterium]|nr:F0F1 ATP synthase subunit gamma [Candidatus Aminicenantes bacterium]
PFGLSPDWEPGKSTLLSVLVPRYIETQITHFFSESIAAEHAARMMAMDNATQNAEDLIEDLTLVLNKIRQASITKELLEIMTAVDALAKK